MAKKKQKAPMRNKKDTDDKAITLSDQLNGDVLAKLKSAKKELVEAERQQEEERQAQLAFQRKEREKNKSFEELLDEYGFSGSKY